MKRTLIALFAVACGSATHVEPAPRGVAPMPPRLEADVVTDRMTYAFRASPAVNLVYQLDCMAGMAPCSRGAFEDTWRTKLGFDGADRAALDVWRTTRNGRHVVSPDEKPPADAARFEARFDQFWATRKDDLATQVAGFARVMNRADVRALIESIATFYEPEVPPKTQLTIELIARPKHDSPDNGQQLGTVSVVEVLPNATAESRLDVVLHESFHFLFGTVAKDKREGMLARFIASNERVAIPAYGLLNEALAAAFGQGLVMRLVARESFEKRMKEARGLYDDAAVDAIAKAILPILDATLAAHSTLFGPTFAGEYLRAVDRALPKLAPHVFLTPMVSLYDPALRNAEFHLYDVMHGGHTESDDDFGDQGLRLLRSHPTWATVFAVRPETIESLASVPDYVDARMMATLRAEAKRPPFVFTALRQNAGPVFVLVSKDDAEMTTLDEAFATLEEIVPGTWRPRLR